MSERESFCGGRSSSLSGRSGDALEYPLNRAQRKEGAPRASVEEPPDKESRGPRWEPAWATEAVRPGQQSRTGAAGATEGRPRAATPGPLQDFGLDPVFKCY